MNEKYQILLYYNYTNIEDPKSLMESQRELCLKLGLKGRIIIAKEGINGTVEGTYENTEIYVKELLRDKRFIDTHIKRSEGTGFAFPKLSIKVREEIVSAHLGKDDVNPREMTGKYLKPEELHQWFEQKRDFVVVDMRNDYEHKSGYFEGSVLPQIENFRDLPKVVEEIKNFKDKTIVTVCTGGVRCEKASGYLVKMGFKDVYQLYGGIVSYMEKFPNEHFLGKLYVFDNRIVLGYEINSDKHRIVGKCDKCGNPSDHYVNCANLMCHKHFIICEDCLNKTNGIAYCSDKCIKIGNGKVPRKKELKSS